MGKVPHLLLRRLIDTLGFSLEYPSAKELPVNRQVLEYCTDGRDSFAVDPALQYVLSGSERSISRRLPPLDLGA
jgi:hypothetical protein